MRNVFALGTIVIEREQDGTYRFVKPIRPPNLSVELVNEGRTVPDQEVAVRWLEKARSNLIIPLLDEGDDEEVVRAIPLPAGSDEERDTSGTKISKHK